MKKLILVAVAFFFLAGFAFAEEQSGDNYYDNSVDYVFEFGDGIAIVIFGDGNEVIVGGALTEENEQVLNEIYLRGNAWYEITYNTAIYVDGTFTIFKRIIKRYETDPNDPSKLHVEIVWTEQ